MSRAALRFVVCGRTIVALQRRKENGSRLLFGAGSALRFFSLPVHLVCVCVCVCVFFCLVVRFTATACFAMRSGVA